MSVKFAMKIETLADDDLSEGAAGAVLRQVDDRDAPVESPVHQLQHELSRLHAPTQGSVPLSDLATAIHDEMVPGWLRLALPVALSLVLWALIFRVTGLIG